MDELVAVGKLHSVYGVKGNIKFELFLDLYLPPEIYIKTEKGELVKAQIQTVDKKKGLIKFFGYDTPEKSKQLSNSYIYIDRNYLPKLGEDEYFIFELIDSVVVYEGREVGKVKKVDDRLPQTQLIIECNDGKVRYLPFVDKFIKKVDRQGKEISISPPEGWFEL